MLMCTQQLTTALVLNSQVSILTRTILRLLEHRAVKQTYPCEVVSRLNLSRSFLFFLSFYLLATAILFRSVHHNLSPIIRQSIGISPCHVPYPSSVSQLALDHEPHILPFPSSLFSATVIFLKCCLDKACKLNQFVIVTTVFQYSDPYLVPSWI